MYYIIYMYIGRVYMLAKGCCKMTAVRDDSGHVHARIRHRACVNTLVAFNLRGVSSACSLRFNANVNGRAESRAWN